MFRHPDTELQLSLDDDAEHNHPAATRQERTATQFLLMLCCGTRVGGRRRVIRCTRFPGACGVMLIGRLYLIGDELIGGYVQQPLAHAYAPTARQNGGSVVVRMK